MTSLLTHIPPHPLFHSIYVTARLTSLALEYGFFWIAFLPGSEGVSSRMAPPCLVRSWWRLFNVHWKCRGWTSVRSIAIASGLAQPLLPLPRTRSFRLWAAGGLLHSQGISVPRRAPSCQCLQLYYRHPCNFPWTLASFCPVCWFGATPLFFFFLDYYYLLGFLFLFIILPLSSTSIILTHHSILSLHMVWGVRYQVTSGGVGSQHTLPIYV